MVLYCTGVFHSCVLHFVGWCRPTSCLVMSRLLSSFSRLWWFVLVYIVLYRSVLLIVYSVNCRFSEPNLQWNGWNAPIYVHYFMCYFKKKSLSFEWLKSCDLILHRLSHYVHKFENVVMWHLPDSVKYLGRHMIASFYSQLLDSL